MLVEASTFSGSTQGCRGSVAFASSKVSMGMCRAELSSSTWALGGSLLPGIQVSHAKPGILIRTMQEGGEKKLDMRPVRGFHPPGEGLESTEGQIGFVT